MFTKEALRNFQDSMYEIQMYVFLGFLGIFLLILIGAVIYESILFKDWKHGLRGLKWFFLSLFR
ncbi:MAG: hypothetical protein AAF316_00170 [Cyanobacteria bacterium P01_A01_bin.80]